MNDEVLGLIREAKALCKDYMSVKGLGSRELSIVITKLDEAGLWRQRDLQLKTPPVNECNEDS